MRRHTKEKKLILILPFLVPRLLASCSRRGIFLRFIKTAIGGRRITVPNGCFSEILLYLIDEGLAVGTFLFGRIHLVGSHFDGVQSTVIFGLGVVGAVLDGTLDTFVLSAYSHDNASFN